MNVFTLKLLIYPKQNIIHDKKMTQIQLYFNFNEHCHFDYTKYSFMVQNANRFWHYLKCYQIQFIS